MSVLSDSQELVLVHIDTTLHNRKLGCGSGFFSPGDLQEKVSPPINIDISIKKLSEFGAIQNSTCYCHSCYYVCGRQGGLQLAAS